MTAQILGWVIDLSETRDILAIKDTLGEVADLVPIGNTETRIKVQLKLASGRSIEFWTSVPSEVVPYLSEHVQVPRTVSELAKQLENDLAGVEDDHDKAVKAAEAGVSSLNIDGLKKRLLDEHEAFEARRTNDTDSEPVGE